MALLNLILFLVVLTLETVTGAFLEFHGQCPEPSPTEDFQLDLNGKYYYIAETTHGARRTNLVTQFKTIGANEVEFTDKFRIINNDDPCEEIISSAFIKEGLKGVFDFSVELGVLTVEPVEFDSNQRKIVADLLKSNGLDFVNEYITPVQYDKPCD